MPTIWELVVWQTVIEPHTTAVIWHLSEIPTVSTLLVPFTYMVQADPGTILILVWSQLIISSGGTSSILVTALMSSKYCSFSSSKLVTDMEFPLLFTNLSQYRRDFAQ